MRMIQDQINCPNQFGLHRQNKMKIHIFHAGLEIDFQMNDTNIFDEKSVVFAPHLDILEMD